MFLCDTNVLSEFVRPDPNAGLLNWVRDLPGLTISSISVDEVYFGLSWKPNPRVFAAVAAFLDANCEVLPVTEQIARRSGELRGSLRSQGKTRTQADMLIAATAHVHDLTLVTRNVRDFMDCPIPVLNPFT